MSEYTPLAKDEDYDLDEHDPHLRDGPTAKPLRQRGHTALVCGIVALLVVNVLAWVFASVRLKGIYHAIQESLDIVDTRSLPRPDTGNGLEVLLAQAAGGRR